MDLGFWDFEIGSLVVFGEVQFVILVSFSVQSALVIVDQTLS